MEILSIEDPYAIHYDTFAGDIYTISTASITLTSGTLTAEQLISTNGAIINSGHGTSEVLSLRGWGTAANQRGGHFEWYYGAGDTLKGYMFSTGPPRICFSDAKAISDSDSGNAWVNVADGSASFAGGNVTIAADGDISCQDLNTGNNSTLNIGGLDPAGAIINFGLGRTDTQIKEVSTGVLQVIVSGFQINNGDAILNLDAGEDSSSITSDTGTVSFDDDHISSTGGDLRLMSDTAQVEMGGAADLVLGHNGTNSIITNNTGKLIITSPGNIELAGDQTFAGTAGFYPRRLNQAAAPASGTGATQVDTGELVIWRDSDTGEVHLVYNDTDTGVSISEFLGED